MPKIILFNKPFRVLSQFRAHEDKETLAEFFTDKTLRVAGRLDYDSEGLLLLSDDGKFIQKVTHPRFKLPKKYWAQVEGQIDEAAVTKLSNGIELKDGPTKPAVANIINEPDKLWPRDPPVRYRANIPTSWLELSISEGRNRQVRRMTAAIGFPTLRLVRAHIGEWQLDNLQPGEYREIAASDA
jgi:23S rRNA pseudouridine2457 synthase